MFDTEIGKHISEVAVGIAARLVRPLRAIIRQEIYTMTDAVDRLSAQTDTTLKTLIDLVTEVQKDVALLASTPKDDSAALDAVTQRLKTGSDAAAAALLAIQTPVAAQPAPAPAQPAPAAEAPAPQSPAPAPSPATA